MKRISLLLLVSAFAPSAFSAEPVADEPVRGGMWVTELDGKKGEQEAPLVAEKSPKAVPQVNPRVRDAVLKKTGLEGEVAGMDELEKNLLVLRARNLGLDYLKKKYPALPAAGLQRLVEAVR